MNIQIPPVPSEYRMVNLHGTDLAEANGHKVIGLYDAIYDALDETKIEMFYNWCFADILLPPAYVVIDDSTLGEFIINEDISVKSDDTVSLIGATRIPVIDPLSVVQNGTYSAPEGVDGFSPVTVEVPSPPPPVLVSLNATENGNYTPGTGEDGFSDVTVEVPSPPPPVLVSLNATENGTYTPGTGEDGFSDVTVAVPDPPSPVLVSLNATSNGDYTPGVGEDGFSSVNVAVPPVKVMDNFCVNWDFTNPINTNGQSSYTGNNVAAIDGWVVYAATMKLVTGGITVEKTGSSWGGFLQRIKASLISYLSGKQLTISAIIDGELVSGTFTFPTTTGGTAAYGIPDCTIRIYRQASGVSEVTIDAAPAGSPHVISAYKVEFGSTQTLATKVNGIWVVNQNMNVDAEKLKRYIILN